MKALKILLLLATVVLASADDDIIESSVLPEYSDIPTLSNGHLGFVVYGDAILMNGLYNGMRGESHRARIPNYSNVLADSACTDNCLYRLHLMQGYFEKVLTDASGFRLTQHMYAHRFYNRAIVNRYVLERTSGSPTVTINLSVDPGNETSVDLTLVSRKEDTAEGVAFTIRCYETNEVENSTYQLQPSPVCIAHTNVPSNLSLSTSQSSSSYTHITIVGKTEDEIRAELVAIVQNEMSYASFFASHASQWQEEMSKYGISVQGNSELNQVIRTSIFYLISNLPSSRTNQEKHVFYGLSPSGIGKGGVLYAEYQGHSFWDTEMWMHPPILLLNPKWSEELLNYRYVVRNAAADNARHTGYQGYRYPWESAFTGWEVTPDCCPEVVEFQHHIISDIAFAFRSHLAATRDLSWWKNYGCDIAWNTAKFWESRVRFNATTNLYDIRNVMGPDEDHHDIDNNVYTNVNAAINLYFGDFAGCACRDALGISSEDEYRNFSRVARSLKLLYDEEQDFHPQFEGYNGEEIKQGDAVLLGYPLQLPMNASTKRNDLIFYDNVTRSTGPAMTWGVHTIGFLDIQDQVEAAKVFERSFTVYTHKPFHTWSENQPGTPGAGNFITGAGGFLQSIINGYAGIRLHFNHMSITNFFTPPNTTALVLNGITYLKNRFSMRIANGTAVLKFLSVDSEHPIKLTVKPANEVHYPTAFASISFDRDQKVIMEPTTNTFGSCEMKETQLGVEVIPDPTTTSPQPTPTATSTSTPVVTTSTTTTTTGGAGMVKVGFALASILVLLCL